MSEIIKQLAQAQEKLRAIDKLSNIIQKVNAKQAQEVAYLIHRIIEADYIHSGIARELLSWSIEANKELFITV